MQPDLDARIDLRALTSANRFFRKNARKKGQQKLKLFSNFFKLFQTFFKLFSDFFQTFQTFFKLVSNFFQTSPERVLTIYRKNRFALVKRRKPILAPPSGPSFFQKFSKTVWNFFKTFWNFFKTFWNFFKTFWKICITSLSVYAKGFAFLVKNTRKPSLRLHTQRRRSFAPFPSLQLFGFCEVCWRIWARLGLWPWWQPGANIRAQPGLIWPDWAQLGLIWLAASRRLFAACLSYSGFPQFRLISPNLVDLNFRPLPSGQGAQ